MRFTGHEPWLVREGGGGAKGSEVAAVAARGALGLLTRPRLLAMFVRTRAPRYARRLLRTFQALGYPDDKVRLVVNRHDKHAAIALADLEKAVGARVAFGGIGCGRDASCDVSCGRFHAQGVGLLRTEVCFLERDTEPTAEEQIEAAVLNVARYDVFKLSEAVLVDLGVPMGPVIASIHEKRDELRERIRQGGELDRKPKLRTGAAEA